MGFWSALWKNETTDWVYGLLSEPQVTNAYGQQRLVPKGRAYVSATLRRMRIPYSRKGWNAYSGAVHCFAELAYQNEAARVKLHALATPVQLKQLAPTRAARIEMRQQRLFGPVPYRGGDLALELGLFSVETDLAAPYLALLGKLAPLVAVPALTAALGLVETFKDGIDRLSQQDHTALEVGVANTFSELRTGCYVLVGSQATPDALKELTVDAEDRLLRKGVPVVEPYVVFTIDATTTRDDYLALANVGPAYRAVQDELRQTPRDPKRLDTKLELLRTAALTSPDLLNADAERIHHEMQQLIAPAPMLEAAEVLVPLAAASDAAGGSAIVEPQWAVAESAAQLSAPAVAAAPVMTSSALKRNVIANMVMLDRVTSVEESVTAHRATGALDDTWLQQIRTARAELAAQGEAAMPPYRTFYSKPDMTVTEMATILAEMERAVGTPEAYFDAIQLPRTGDEIIEEGVIDFVSNVIKTGLSLPDPISEEQQEGIARLRADCQLDPDVAINPNDHTFETSDPGWWHLLKADRWDKLHWPEGLAPFIADSPERPFVYDGRDGTRAVALLADFGVGQYHAQYIARQLADRAYPYVFHLGDVYYGGTSDELASNYSSVLGRVMDKSVLFSLPENHELYSGGFAYQAFLRTELARKRIVQQGSYFCVRFPEHQVIGLDVNWNGRQRFAHEPSRRWLRKVLRDGQGLTTILLTGSAPYCYGKHGTTDLFRDLEEWHKLGLFHAWFWGDDHYCALFERDDTFKFVGSCIGHGGFPGNTQVGDKPCPARVAWVEREPRFPKGYRLRDDLSNNGWVELTMHAGGGIGLVYYDWLSDKRLGVDYHVAGQGPTKSLVRAEPMKEFARREGPFR